MSHKVTVVTQIKDRGVLGSVCKDFGVDFISRPDQKIKLFTSEATGDFSFKLKDWLYPVVVNSVTGEIAFDNYNGAWGKEADLNKLIQEYNLRLAEQEAESFVLQGWTVERQSMANGDIQVVIQHG